MNVFNNFSFYDTLKSIMIELSIGLIVLVGGICFLDVFVMRRGNTHTRPSNMCSPRPDRTLRSSPLFATSSPELNLSSSEPAAGLLRPLNLPETSPVLTANLTEPASSPPELGASSIDPSPLPLPTSSPSPATSSNELSSYSPLFDASFLDFTMGSSEFSPDTLEADYGSDTLDYANISRNLMIYDEDSKSFGYANLMGFSSCWSPTCNICMEEMNVDKNIAGLLCMHCFHADCLKRWMAEKPDCPVCRQPTQGIISKACSTFE